MRTRAAPAPRDDPRYVSTQMQIRAPFWRQQQLREIARKQEIPLAVLLVDAIDRVYPPKPPES